MPPWTLEALEELATELFADDLLPLGATAYELLKPLDQRTVEHYFLNGGQLPPPLPPPPPPREPPSCSVNASSEDLAGAVRSVGQSGLLTLSDMPIAPFAELALVFDDICSERLGVAYPSGLAVKAGATAGADMKRILDLNPPKLAEAAAVLTNGIGAAELPAAGAAAAEATHAFASVVSFWQQCASEVAPKLRAAVAAAAECNDILCDNHFDFRMVDYYERSVASGSGQSAPAPRCRAHRDFGSFTLIFAREPGLQVQGAGSDDDQAWIDIAVPATGCALLLFGFVTQVRSNGRLHAAQHRVVDAPEAALSGNSARRTSFVFFISPDDMQAPLYPVVLPGEERRFVDGKSAEAQMMFAVQM